MTQDYLIGMQLDEYRLESLLGRGGMARVYRAMDINLERPAAIKVIDIPHRAEIEYVQRFKREAQAIAQLDHPHIVRLYRYGEVQAGPAGDSVLYMAMQFIEGADLQFILASYRKDGEFVEEREVSRIIREICEALDYAHSKGITHRDIKSSNIMIDSQGRAVLTDFGLAMLSTQATRGEIFGSPHYIAPEQAMSSAKAVPQSDLYAVGVILYEMLTGILPFNAAEPLELAMMHMNRPVPSPRESRAEISEELENVMLKALEKRPEDRYQTGKELADALDTALQVQRQTVPQQSASIPQRVTLGLAAQALPPKAITPPVRNEVLPGTVQGAEVAATMAVLPGSSAGAQPEPAIGFPTIDAGFSPAKPETRKPQNRRFFVYVGMVGLLLILCIAGSSIIFYNQFLAKPKETPAAGSSLAKSPTVAVSRIEPTATQDQTPVAAQAATQAPSSGSMGSITYQFDINRRGEDKGYLVIVNTGAVDLPVNQLTLQAEKGEIAGSAWGVTTLAPGGCLLARKEDRKDQGLPEGVSCNLAGQTVLVLNSQDDLFKEKLEILFAGRPVGECERENKLCQLSFTNE